MRNWLYLSWFREVQRLVLVFRNTLSQTWESLSPSPGASTLCTHTLSLLCPPHDRSPVETEAAPAFPVSWVSLDGDPLDQCLSYKATILGLVLLGHCHFWLVLTFGILPWKLLYPEFLLERNFALGSTPSPMGFLGWSRKPSSIKLHWSCQSLLPWADGERAECNLGPAHALAAA